jgi:uncharacterized membrane protein YqjE
MLNLRHKLAVCATVVCVGLIFLLGGAVRTAVSIGLLGVAFSWAFGSNYRLVHWLCVGCGLLLLISVAGDGFVWRREKPSFIKDQLAMVENDRSLLKDEEADIQRETDRQKYNRDVSEYTKDLQELAHLKGETVFRHVMRIDWETIVGGILLLSAGLGLVLGVKPVPK